MSDMGKYDARISRMGKRLPRPQEIETRLSVYHGTYEKKANFENTIVLWSGDPEIEKHNAEVFDRLMHGDDFDE